MPMINDTALGNLFYTPAKLVTAAVVGIDLRTRKLAAAPLAHLFKH